MFVFVVGVIVAIVISTYLRDPLSNLQSAYCGRTVSWDPNGIIQLTIHEPSIGLDGKL